MSVVYRDLNINCSKNNFICEKVTGYEHGVKVFRFKPLNGNIPIDLSDCTGAAYVGTKSDGKIIGNACEIKDNKILLPLSLQMTTARGNLNGHIEVYFPNGTLKFFGVNFEVFTSPETAEIESKDEFTLLESKIAEVNKIIAEGIETSQGKSAYEIAVENGFAGTIEEWLESLKGKDGADGKDGKDGTNGIDGKDGQNGADGIGITTTEINESGELVLTYSDGSSVNVGAVVGAKGEKGDKGDTGESGPAGADGTDYVLTDTDKAEIATLIRLSMPENFKFIGEVETTEEVSEIILEHTWSPKSIVKVIFCIPRTSQSVTGSLYIDGMAAFTNEKLFVNSSNPVYGFASITIYERSNYDYIPAFLECMIYRHGDSATYTAPLNSKIPNANNNGIKFLSTGDTVFPIGTKLYATEIYLARSEL